MAPMRKSESQITASFLIFSGNIERQYVMRCAIWYRLYNLKIVKNREKHPWRSVNFSKVAGFSLVPFGSICII